MVGLLEPGLYDELLHEKIVSHRLFITTRASPHFRNVSLEINELAHVTLSMKNTKRGKEKKRDK